MNVKKMYNELIFTSLLLNLFDALLSAGAIFSIGYFLVYFYRIPVIIALIASIIFFFRSIILKVRQNKILLLEKKYPNLKERLRTSFEFQEHSNTVINDLHTDILGLMKKVDINAFFSSKRVVMKSAIICGMLLTTLYLSSIGFDSLDIKNAIIKSDVYRRGTDYFSGIFDETREETKNRSLLDKPNLIDSGNKELNISIDTYNTELDIKDISDPKKNDFGGNYPKEIAGTAEEVYEEEIPEEYKDAVKEYFKKINE